MTLFKLKKDGKTVGHLKIQKGQILFCKVEWDDVEDRWRNWQDVGRNYRMHFDTALPFVCKDKNKKDVFAGDKVKWKESDKLIAEAYGDEAEIEAVVEGGFLFWDVDGSTFCPADEIGDTELIEEQK